MIEEEFAQYLTVKGRTKEQITVIINQLRQYQEFLQKKDVVIDSIPKGMILEYTEHLVKKGKSALELINALYNYAYFIKKYDYVVEIIDIIESYSAMESLKQRIAEKISKEISDEVFENIIIPPVGANPEKKPSITKIVMKRLEEKIGEEKTIEILAPCLHGRPIEPIEKDREDFLRLNDIDKFLEVKKKEFIERLEKHNKEGTLEFAQYVDDEVVKYVRDHPTMTPGIRDGDKIIVSKIPYQIKKHLNAKEDKMKRYYSCYCTWVRSAIKNGEEKEISANFCHCSAGFFKIYWDIIFDQSVKVVPIDTPLTGALECKFAVNIPEEYLKRETNE